MFGERDQNHGEAVSYARRPAVWLTQHTQTPYTVCNIVWETPAARAYTHDHVRFIHTVTAEAVRRGEESDAASRRAQITRRRRRSKWKEEIDTRYGTVLSRERCSVRRVFTPRSTSKAWNISPIKTTRRQRFTRHSVIHTPQSRNVPTGEAVSRVPQYKQTNDPCTVQYLPGGGLGSD
mgnify:CR=1 FL=1